MQPKFKKMLYGGDYNPNQWPKEIWDEDMKLFHQAGINSTTINVFSWAKIQPSENEYDFTELDEIVDTLTKEDVQIVMATSTGALPAWMVHRYPEVARTDFEGRHHKFGHRHNACPNSPVFQKYAKRLAEKLAERYGDNKNIVCWHISNEYGGECYCENCAKAFRVWLKDKYKTLDEVNKAWNMEFWGHTIYDWDEIVPPNDLGDGMPWGSGTAFAGMSLDYMRFNSDGMLNNYKMERDAIRKYDKETPITTNLMGTYKGLDYFKWAKEMDIVSWDNYPSYNTPWSHVAMTHDLMRGLKDAPFMLMEQTPNQQNWFPFCKVKQPGEVRKLSWQAVAHGADTVRFFQMKQSLGGCERFHGAVIAHDGTEESRVFKETAALGEELDRIGRRIMGSRIESRVAIMFDWQSYWSLEGCVGPTTGFNYPNEVHRFYRALWRRNVPVDMIASTTPLARLSQYDLAIAPALITVLPGVAETLEAYVADGGPFITGYMAGIHDEHDLVVPGGYPGKLRRLMGVWVEEIDALAPGETIEVHGGTVDAKGEIVASIIHREGAERLATYGGDEFYAGHSALTVNAYGKGKAHFAGTPLDETGMSAFMAPIIKELDLKSLDTPEDVSLSVRYGDGGTRYAFLINNSAADKRLCLSELNGGTELLTGTVINDLIELKPYGVDVIALR